MSPRRANSDSNTGTNRTDSTHGTDTADLRRLARETFGWDTLRPGQLEAIEAAASGRDVLAVMPTGYGKSAVYQVAALAVPGIAVVVSPLIALQHDQVEDLDAALGRGRAFALNSTNSVAEHDDAWVAAADGTAGFLFLAPEQLVREEVLDRLKTLSVSLLVVDEAHCVSTWGHDFRPDYLRLGEVAEQLGRPTVVALTATAAAPVQAEIIERLNLRKPLVQARGFDRPNLYLDVVRHADDGAKRSAVTANAEELAQAGEVAAPESRGAGLIYVARRRDTDYYCEQLAEAGLRAEAYHSGRRKSDRDDIHRQFLDGELDVVVATSAFGMGIDKSDVRFVLHADIPDSVDSYYQEIGRAGRDGEPARAVLHYRPEDLGLRRFFAARRPDPEALRTLIDVVSSASGPRSMRELREATGLSARRLTALLNLLSEAGAVTTDDGSYRTRLPRPTGTAERDATAAAAVSAAIDHAEARERVDNSRVEMMRQYAEADGCRRQFLLGYFGEQLAEPCGNCDTCTEGTALKHASAQSPDQASPHGDEEFPLQSAVVHPEWGAGVVMKLEEDRITVLFDSGGYRALDRQLIADKQLLTLRS